MQTSPNFAHKSFMLILNKIIIKNFFARKCKISLKHIKIHFVKTKWPRLVRIFFKRGFAVNRLNKFLTKFVYTSKRF